MIVDYITKSGSTYRINHSAMNFMQFASGNDIPSASGKFTKIMADDEVVDRPIIGKTINLVGVKGTWTSTPVVAIQEQLDLGLDNE